jgi:hypothetical protein
MRDDSIIGDPAKQPHPRFVKSIHVPKRVDMSYKFCTNTSKSDAISGLRKKAVGLYTSHGVPPYIHHPHKVCTKITEAKETCSDKKKDVFPTVLSKLAFASPPKADVSATR